MTAPVLDETADAARCASCGHLPGCRCPEACEPPARFQPVLAVYAGHPDDTRFIPLGASVDLDGLAAILRSGEGGRYLRVRLCVPGQPDAPLVLCCEAGGWTLLRDGAVLAEIKSSSEGESR